MQEQKASTPNPNHYRIGQFLLARGDEGDLVAARVDVLQTACCDTCITERWSSLEGGVALGDGVVTVRNLLTGKRQQINADLLAKRTVAVPPEAANKVLESFTKEFTVNGRDRAKASASVRQLAVELGRSDALPEQPTKVGAGPREEPAPPKPLTPVEDMVNRFFELSEDDKQAFAKAVWGDVLESLGVQ